MLSRFTFRDHSPDSIVPVIGAIYFNTEIMRSSARTYGCAMLLSFGLLLIAMPSVQGLSDTICNNIQAEWQSDEPRLQGAFPFYTLLGKSLVTPRVLIRLVMTSLPVWCSVLHRQSNPGGLQCGLLRQ